MKKLIITITVTACIALCAAVWAHSEMVEEIPTLTPTAAVCAAEEVCAEPEAAEKFIPTENKISLVRKRKNCKKADLWQDRSRTELVEIPIASETQPVQAQTSATASTQESVPAQTTKELQSGDLVYVPGFGWVPYEGPNHCEDGTDIYENGNKIGVMG